MRQDAAVKAWRPPGILRMNFQPIIDTARGTVAGYESLARFGGPQDATPDCWFALAHAAGVGEELEARALQTALEARSALPPNCFLSVNVGPQALLSEPVAAVFAEAGDLRGVVVEITEQTAVDNAAKQQWLAKTKCRTAYAMADCSGYKAPKTSTTTTPGAATAPSTSSTPGTSSTG